MQHMSMLTDTRRFTAFLRRPHGSFPKKTTFPVLPSLDRRVVHTLRVKAIELQNDIGDREELAYQLYGVLGGALELVDCRGQPPFWTLPIIKPCLCVNDTLDQ